MASPLTPAQMLAVLDKWLPDRYRLYPDWKTRTRPGDIHPHGFIVHHTGGPFTHSAAYLEFLFETGRPDEGIPGPLCNQAIDDLGICHIGSLGRTNNAGAGYQATLDHVKAEDYAGYTNELHPGLDDYFTGNAEYWGVEIMYPGTLEMRPAQFETAVLLCAALMDAYGWSALSTIGHREHSERKWDPGNISMAAFRRAVRDRLAAGPPTEGEPMPTPDEIADAVWTEKRPDDGAASASPPFSPSGPDGTQRHLATLLLKIRGDTHAVKTDVAEMKSDVAAIKEALVNAGITPGDVRVGSFTDAAKTDMANAVIAEIAD